MNALITNNGRMSKYMKTMADRDTRVQLVLEAAKQFPSGAGGIAWSVALEAHPEWKATLGAQNESGLSRLRAFSNSVLKKQPRQVHAPAQAQTERSGGPPRDMERQALVLEARCQFPSPRGMGVAWTRAFEAHPEWRAKLRAEDQAGLNRLYAYTSHVMKSHRKTKRQTRADALRNATPAPVAAPVVIGVKHCPECGYRLAEHNQVYAAAHEIESQFLKRLENNNNGN